MKRYFVAFFFLNGLIPVYADIINVIHLEGPHCQEYLLFGDVSVTTSVTDSQVQALRRLPNIWNCWRGDNFVVEQVLPQDMPQRREFEQHVKQIFPSIGCLAEYKQQLLVRLGNRGEAVFPDEGKIDPLDGYFGRGLWSASMQQVGSTSGLCADFLCSVIRRQMSVARLLRAYAEISWHMAALTKMDEFNVERVRSWFDLLRKDLRVRRLLIDRIIGRAISNALQCHSQGYWDILLASLMERDLFGRSVSDDDAVADIGVALRILNYTSHHGIAPIIVAGTAHCELIKKICVLAGCTVTAQIGISAQTLIEEWCSPGEMPTINRLKAIVAQHALPADFIVSLFNSTTRKEMLKTAAVQLLPKQ